jgi:hypothetical protein
MRDIRRKIAGDPDRQAAFAQLLLLAHAVRHQQQRQRGKKIYSLHAPEIECIAKGKSHKPYEFGVKVSIGTTSTIPGAASSLRTRRRFREIPTTATRWKASSPMSSIKSARPSIGSPPTRL